MMNTALIIIDVQQSLVEEGVWEYQRIISNINQLLKKACLEKIPVILVQDVRIEPNKNFHPLLNVSTKDKCIIKSHCDSFINTDLDTHLKSHNITKLVIGGMQTEYCVDATCRQAVILGYDVVLIRDGHSTIDNEYLKAFQIIAHHNEILDHLDTSDNEIRIKNTNEILFN